MICCDQCGEWFHVNCIGITEADAVQMDENDTPYICNEGKQKGMDTQIVVLFFCYPIVFI